MLAMEDRKRPVPHEPSDDSLPPFKRPALNSPSSSQAPQNSHQVPQSQEDVIVSRYHSTLQSPRFFISIFQPRIPPTLGFRCRTRSSLLPSANTHSYKHFQKEAIWRQMMEYKRERNMLESRVEELDKRSTYHDDHLRVIDAWWAQVRPRSRSCPS